MTDLVFPKMSAADGAIGVITSWFVETGERVTPETLVAEVAMDKVNGDVYPEVSGVITVLIGEGQEVPQGTVIATITLPVAKGHSCG